MMHKNFVQTLIAALPLALLLPLGAAEQTITRQQADLIVSELRQIRTLLERQGKSPEQQQPARARIDLSGASMLGSKDAPLTLVEFTDYQCPFCKKFHSSAFPDLKKNYIDTGKLRFYSLDLPLDAIHPNAERAAQAGHCAGDQGRFWELREVMAINPGLLAMDNLMTYAKDLKLDVDAFRVCVEDQKYKDAVQKDVTEAETIGARGTPSFVLGRSTPQGVDGELLVGFVSYLAFEQKLKQLISGE